MAFVDTISAQRSRGLAMSGLLSMLVLTVLSLISVNVFSYNIAFGFLPLTGVYLWPRLSDPILSVFGLYVLGVLADLIGETPIGFWAFTYLTYFIIFRPDRHETTSGLFGQWFGFIVATLAVSFFMFVVSFLFVKQPINLLDLVFAWLPVIAVFPLIFWSIRAIGRKNADGSGAGFVT